LAEFLVNVNTSKACERHDFRLVKAFGMQSDRYVPFVLVFLLVGLLAAILYMKLGMVGERNIAALLSGAPVSQMRCLALTVHQENEVVVFEFVSEELVSEWNTLFAKHSVRYQGHQFGFYGELRVEFEDDSVWEGDVYFSNRRLHLVLPSRNPTEGHWPTHMVDLSEMQSVEFERRWEIVVTARSGSDTVKAIVE
jgi:hypothetical protein